MQHISSLALHAKIDLLILNTVQNLLNIDNTDTDVQFITTESNKSHFSWQGITAAHQIAQTGLRTLSNKVSWLPAVGRWLAPTAFPSCWHAFLFGHTVGY